MEPLQGAIAGSRRSLVARTGLLLTNHAEEGAAWLGHPTHGLARPEGIALYCSDPDDFEA